MTVRDIISLLDVIKSNLHKTIHTYDEYEIIQTYLNEILWYMDESGIAEKALDNTYNLSGGILP